MFALLACCLLATTQAIKVPPESCVNEQGYYPVTQVVDHSCACNAKSAGTLRYRDNKIQFCNGVNYVELGGGKEPELGSKETPAKSCSEILKERTDAKSGEYYLKQGGATIKVYCYMEEMCGSRGWTMIMKIDGKKNTFNFNSKYWTNKETYNVAGASKGLDNTEVKLDTYWRTPFSKLCLGTKTAGKTRWMTLNYRANSLYAVIADGKYRATHSGRAAWKSLISGSSLQPYCNREGFNVNVKDIRARIGIVNNQENNCLSPDSRLGFGTSGTRCGQSANNAAGNEARCRPDNGDKSIRSFGYIFAQEQLDAHLGSFDKPAPSCKAIKAARRDAKSGEYYLKQGGATIKVYCYMEEMCGSRGWTMIMKIDGKKNTFNFNSKYWTNKETYNVAGASRGLDNTEVKLDTYWRTPFSKLCLGTKTAGKTRWMTLNYRANSLYAVIADGKYRATHSGRAAWKSLISGSSLQPYCNREGFNVNVKDIRARIGIVNNQENNCLSPDSRLGFGTSGTRCGQSANNAAGNEARCRPDNGDKSIRSFGYIFAQEQLDAHLGSFDKPASSCKAIKSGRSGAGNGVYYLKLNGKAQKVYCHMDAICGSTGWTLLLKMDGSKPTFKYDSTQWTSDKDYNAGAVSQGLNTNSEMKLHTYSSFPFLKLCLGMKVGASTRWIPVSHKASSLYSIIESNKYQATSVGRNAWKSLVSGSSLQKYCNREGFNVNLSIKARIGITSNQENNCNSPDSYVGFGVISHTGCGLKNTITAGNGAGCSPDNGNKNIAAMGFVLAQ